MNKYLKWTIFFTALWIFMFFIALPLFIDSIGVIPVVISMRLPFIEVWISYALYYGTFFIAGLAIITGITASWQTIKAKSKWASVMIILTLVNILFLFGNAYAGIGI